MRLAAVLPLIFWLTLALLPASRALAFGACVDTGYLAAFDARLAGPQACTFHELHGLVINGHPSRVRLAILDSDDNGGTEAWIDDINRTLDDVSFAATALSADLRIQDVTILLTSLQFRDETGPAHGITHGGRRTLPSECPITLFKLQDGVATPDFAATVAHELFHCIQSATWPWPASRNDAGWWVEGAAEYFAALVVPANTGSLPNAEAYSWQGQMTSIQDDPLDYENVAFFSWLHQSGGGAAVGAFLAGMPASEDFLPVLQRLVPEPRWMAFAQELTSGRLRLPSGAVVDPGGPARYLLLEGDSGTRRDAIGPYQVFRAELRGARPGHYEISVAGEGVVTAKLRIGKEDWHDLPSEISTCRDQGGAELVAVTTQGSGEVEIGYRRTGDCASCEARSVEASCLRGTWVLSEGGPLEWMRAQGIERKFRVEAGEMRIRINSDGSYLMMPLTATGATHDGEISAQGQSLGLSGYWSAQDGMLNICPRGGKIDLRASVNGHASQMMFGPGGDVQMAYDCAGNRLTTTLDFPRGLPPMISTYRREAP